MRRTRSRCFLLLFPTKRDKEGEERDASDAAMQRHLCAPGINPIDLIIFFLLRLVVLPSNRVTASRRGRWHPAVAGATTGAAPLPQVETYWRSRRQLPAVARRFLIRPVEQHLQHAHTLVFLCIGYFCQQDHQHPTLQPKFTGILTYCVHGTIH
ncbi:uncharacterized protein LOC127767804 [Oryza glaberrima]|uniref:uncharacterized protein LOC127767804 n=1 Tax=Oryza glaberrima TaxID=4538 RepID=UPI00224BF5EB|nr:uncharacterized protein LOC127767804 [Oryza glaberrima]